MNYNTSQLGEPILSTYRKPDAVLAFLIGMYFMCFLSLFFFFRIVPTLVNLFLRFLFRYSSIVSFSSLGMKGIASALMFLHRFPLFSIAYFASGSFFFFSGQPVTAAPATWIFTTRFSIERFVSGSVFGSSGELDHRLAPVASLEGFWLS